MERECREEQRKRRMEEKPWRANMKKGAPKREDRGEREEKTGDGEEDDGEEDELAKRPWRNNMRATTTRSGEAETATSADANRKRPSEEETKVIRKYMEERRKEDRVAEWKKQREEGGKREAIKTRLLALEMKRREGYKAKVLAQKKEREGSNHKAEGRAIETSATEARKEKADNTAPQSRVANGDEADERLRKKLEELTMEMRAKFRVRNPGAKTTGAVAAAASATLTRHDHVIPTPTAPRNTNGSVESIEERVKRDIEHAQKMVQQGNASSSSAEVEVNGDRVMATATPASKVDNLRTLRSTESSASVIPMPTSTRSHTTSVGDAAAAAAATIIEESLDVPVRDTSGQLAKESDKLKLMVSEVYARHQSDLEAIRNSNLGIELPSTLTQRSERKQQQEQQALLDAFSAKRSGSTASHPAAKARPHPPPVAVPKADATVVDTGEGSGGGGGGGGGSGGHRSPHKLHMADPSSDDAAAADPFNFMATARRTFEGATSMRHSVQVHQQQQQRPPSVASEAPQGNVVLSEGPLSTSWVSSTGVGGDGANREGGGAHAASSSAEAVVMGGAVKKALAGKGKKSKRRGSGSSGKEPAHSSRGSTTEQKSIVPEALKLRFMAELNQLEGIQHLENQLNKMGSIRDVALANQDAEKMAQKIRLLKARQAADKRAESRAEFESRLKVEMQEILSAKMQRLLERQNEATQVTADAARTLAQLQMSKRHGEPMLSSAEPIPIAKLAKALRRADRKAAVTSDESAVSRTSKIMNADREREREATSTHSTASGGRSATSGPVSRELRSLISKTESRVPEILSTIEHTEASGGSVPRTIAEMIDNLSAEEVSASHNISEDIAAELTEEQPNTAGTGPGSREAYTSKFEDAEDDDSSTVKEVSSAAVVSVSDDSNLNMDKQRKGGEALLEGDGEERGCDYESTSESRLLAPSTSTLSLFSDGDSFNKFTLQMFKQHLEEESIRARHQYDLLKKKEASLIEKAKRELEALQERKNAEGVSEDDRQRAKRRAKLILAELKSRRAEIDQLKKSLKVAEKERSMIMSQQKKMLGERSAAGGGSSTSSTSSSRDDRSRSARSKSKERSPERERERERSQATRETLRSAEHQIMHGLRKMQRNKRLLGELGPEFLEKSKDLERLLKQSKSRNVDSGSESSSVQDEIKSEISEKTSTTTTTTTTAPTSPSKMQNLKKTMGATLKTPLSPKGAPGGGGGVGRKRHSSADSDDSQSVSHSETVSDHSDVEIRINVLQDELRRRMMTAAKLKKQQKAKSKEKLRMKEETLKRQIEKYDKLIQETAAELEEEQVVVQPQIKTPYKAVVAVTCAPTSAPSAARKSFEAAGGEGARARTASPDLSEAGDGDGGEDSGSGQTASAPHESSVPAAETIISKEDKVAREGHLKVGLGEATAAAATISPSKLTSDKGKTNEDDDAGQSDLNYSDDFTSSNGSGTEAPEPPPKKVVSAAKPVTSATAPAPTPTSTQMSSADVAESKKVEEKKLAQADRIAAGILEQLLAETIQFCVAVPKRKQDSGQSRVAMPSLLSPRSRPQDLMLTTFDISSESSDEDGKLSPKRCQRVDIDLENEDCLGDSEGNYIDDDVYGLSIKKESEELRQQELLIEEEIKRIQQESISGRQIPDKPPPPYTPPGSPAVERVPRAPVAPKAVERYVPSSREEIMDLLAPMARELYAAKFGAPTTAAVDKTPDGSLVHAMHPSKRVFVTFLSDLASEIFGAIYSCESESQNPPWMPQKPLARRRLSLPRTESELVARLQREALIFFGMEKRAEKESLIVRWSQKKRDKVDQILVRELHAEEAAWTDYSKDEALVKDQLSEAVLSLLIEDTVKEIKRVRKSA